MKEQSMPYKKLFTIKPLMKVSLVKQIIVALILGVCVGLWMPALADKVEILGSFFIGALKAVAPLLVFVLVTAAIANQSIDTKSHIKPIIVLYIVGTVLAAAVAVLATFLYPVHIDLIQGAAKVSAPSGILEVFKNLLMSMVDNPIKAIANGNYIGILVWAIGLGLALRRAKGSTRDFLEDFANGLGNIVSVVIHLAPFGVFGLVATTVVTSGLDALLDYANLLVVLVGSMLFVALVVNPVITWICIRKNPYPLVLTTIKESAITAFFTRSSAANIPVNLALCKRLDLPESTYSVSIPVGATINMAGAAITISVMTLAAAMSLGVQVDFWTAVLLAVLATFGACGASGVPGGSLMLIPLGCSLFGLSNDIAMEVVAIGFIIGVVQDSFETALNSSSDVLYTAAACLRAERLEKEKLAKNK